MKRYLCLILCLLVLSACASGCSEAASPPPLSKCINIGNALEAPKDQPWDVPMDAAYFSIIQQAGFSCVRLPVRFSDYVDRQSDGYPLDEDFLQQIDGYVHTALNLGLTLILDFHHFLEMMDDPEANRACFVAIWRQLAERYRDQPNALVFELLNEPQGNLDSRTWNDILAQTVRAIRAIDPDRYLIVGGANYNAIDSLRDLVLPDDRYLIATVHYYEPNDVTFQGNPYHAGYESLHGIAWNGTADEVAYLRERLSTAKSWADAHGVPLFLGEFGVSKTAPADTRLSWISAVANEASARGIDYGYWEFASGFGIYDLQSATWDAALLDALIHPAEPE